MPSKPYSLKRIGARARVTTRRGGPVAVDISEVGCQGPLVDTACSDTLNKKCTGSRGIRIMRDALTRPLNRRQASKITTAFFGKHFR